jgi:hypothetical protein
VDSMIREESGLVVLLVEQSLLAFLLVRAA